MLDAADVLTILDQLISYQQAHALLGREPAIPVTYLLACSPAAAAQGNVAV